MILGIKKKYKTIQDVIDSAVTQWVLKWHNLKKSLQNTLVLSMLLVNSGSSTLNLLMWSLLSKQRPTYICHSYRCVSWSTTYFPLLQNHFMPNFVDVNLDTLNIDVTK